MRRLHFFAQLPHCRATAARQRAGFVAANGVALDGAPPGVPVR